MSALALGQRLGLRRHGTEAASGSKAAHQCSRSPPLDRRFGDLKSFSTVGRALSRKLVSLYVDGRAPWPSSFLLALLRTTIGV